MLGKSSPEKHGNGYHGDKSNTISNRASMLGKSSTVTTVTGRQIKRLQQSLHVEKIITWKTWQPLHGWATQTMSSGISIWVKSSPEKQDNSYHSWANTNTISREISIWKKSSPEKHDNGYHGNWPTTQTPSPAEPPCWGNHPPKNIQCLPWWPPGRHSNPVSRKASVFIKS